MVPVPQVCTNPWKSYHRIHGNEVAFLGIPVIFIIFLPENLPLICILKMERDISKTPVSSRRNTKNK